MQEDRLFLPAFIVMVAILAAWAAYSSLKLYDVLPPIRSDGFWYYSYLPLYVLDHRLDFEAVQAPPETFVVFNSSPVTGRLANPYGIGTAICELPFFLIAHLATLLTHAYPTNGYSKPYHISVLIAGISWFGIGMAALWGFLARFFSKWTVLLTAILITFGTSLFYYSTYMASFSHVYSFACLSLFLWASARFSSQPTVRKTVAVGAIAGLLFLIRPYNLIFTLILFPLLVWGEGFTSWRQRIKSAFILSLSTLVIAIPQLALWKHYIGSYIANPYSIFSARLNFAHPHLVEVLFSVEKGLFFWSPLLLVALLGLILMLGNKMRSWALPSILAIGVVAYIIASWPNWWLGDGYGHRGFVDTYPLFAIGLAWLIQKTRARPLYSVPVLVLGIVMTGISVIQMQNYVEGLIPSQGADFLSYEYGLVRPFRRAYNRIRFGSKSSIGKEGLVAVFKVSEKEPERETVLPGDRIRLKLSITNAGSAIWRDRLGPGKIRLVARWISPAGVLARKSQDLMLEIAPGGEWITEYSSTAPTAPGVYTLAFDLEAASLGFFQHLGPSQPLVLPVRVLELVAQLTAACGDGGVPVALATPAALTIPTNNSSFTSSTVRFTRGSSNPAASNYYLWVGSTPRAHGSKNPLPNNIDFANADLTITSTIQLTTLPTKGSTVYVTLWSKINGKLYANDYTFSVQPRRN